MRTLDWRAAGIGALTTLVIVSPALVIGVLKRNDPSGTESNWWLVAALLVLVAFGVGGWAAGRRRPSSPFIHATAASLMAYAALLLIRTLTRVATSDGANFNVANTLLIGQIAVSLAIVGAYVATRRRARA